MLKAFLFFLCFFSSSLCLAGGRESGGGDLSSPKSMAAWFTTKAPVVSCIEIHPHFSIQNTYGEAARPVLEHLVKLAGKIWENYANDRLGPYLKESRTVLDAENLSFPAGVKMIRHCDGTEEVVYYFGVRNDLTREEIKRYHRPIGLSKRLDYSPVTGRGRGFIYIEGWQKPTWETFNESSLWDERGHELPLWRDKTAEEILPILLHEIGHYYGIGYVNGTVMQQDVTLLLSLPKAWLGEIEYTRSLVLPKQDAIVSGRWGSDWSHIGSSRDAWLKVNFDHLSSEMKLVQRVGDEYRRFVIKLGQRFFSAEPNQNLFILWRENQAWPFGKLTQSTSDAGVWAGSLYDITDPEASATPVYFHYNYSSFSGLRSSFLITNRDEHGSSGEVLFSSLKETSVKMLRLDERALSRFEQIFSTQTNDLVDELKDLPTEILVSMPENFPWQSSLKLTREKSQKYFNVEIAVTPTVSNASADHSIECETVPGFWSPINLESLGVSLNERGAGSFKFQGFNGFDSDFYYNFHWDRNGELYVYVSRIIEPFYVRQFYQTLKCRLIGK